MSVVSFDIEEDNKNVINDDKESLINNSRYEVEGSNHPSNSVILQNPKNKKKYSSLFYIFIFSLVILLGFIIFTLITKLSKKENYTLDMEKYLKPNISNSEYTNVKFDNGLELLLIKVDENDTAGGIIAFDTGYLDTDYENETACLKLAFLSLITYEVQNSSKLIDYLGKFDYSIEEHYSFFSFSILNSGFFEYLKKFAQLTYLSPENSDSRYENISKNINLLSKDFNNQNGNLKKIENHILEELVYGYKKEDIMAQNYNEKDINRVKEIMKSLLNPSRMKIILNSHFKVSLMKNKFINYFSNIINKDKSKENKNIYNNIKKDLAKQQVIFMKLPDYATNYIKIIYFIEGIRNIEKYEDYEGLYIDSGYFNYIKYILDGTNKESLYYKLTNSEYYNIKSLSCDFEVVLKSKIKLSININLNYYSYKQLQNIIEIAYEYVNKIKNHIRTLKENETQVQELYTIMKQNFSYSEDFHDNTYINKKRSVNLFCLNHRRYFLRNIWFNKEFNVTNVNIYTTQLTPNNSVLIIGINNYALNNFREMLVNSKFSKVIFNNNKNNSFFDIYYNNDSLSMDLESKFNNDSNIGKDENGYISKYNYNLEYDPKIKFTADNSLPEKIEGNSSLRVFYFKRVTSFGVPKVYIILNFYHPYLRPYGLDEFRNKIFFQLMLYRAFIKREIDLQLGDAMRAGNSINMGFNQNLFFIDIFAFEDVVEKIMNKIKEIISYNFESNDSIFSKKFEIYRDSAVEELYSIYHNSNSDFRMRMNFYEELKDEKKNVTIYNYFKFPANDYRSKIITDIFDNNDDIYNFITNSIIHGNIFGYCSKAQAENISKIFYVNNDDMIMLLSKANLTNFNLTSSNFQEWMTQKYDLVGNKTINDSNCTDDNISEYIFIHWSSFNLIDLIRANVLDVIINNNEYNDKTNKNSTNSTLIKSKVFSQGEIYIQFNLYNKSINYTNIIKDILSNNKPIYNDMIDSIGNRLYYLLKSLTINQYAKREDLKSSAITISDIMTHDIIDTRELDNCKNKNYDEINNTTITNLEKYNYVQFVCKKRN